MVRAQELPPFKSLPGPDRTSHGRLLRYTSFGRHVLQRWWNKTLLPGDVNLHCCRQIEVDAQTDDRKQMDKQANQHTDRQEEMGKCLVTSRKPGCLDRKTMVLGNFLSQRRRKVKTVISNKTCRT